MGISNNISNTYSSDAIFSCLRSGSRPSFRMPNPIITDYHSRGIDWRRKCQAQIARIRGIDEKRLKAQQRLKCYQARLSSAFNKRVKPRSFQVGDLVLAVRRPIITTHHTSNKFTSKWDEPYVVQEVYTNGAYKLIDNDGVRIGPINGKFLKRFYALKLRIAPQ